MALLAEGILKTHWDQTIPVNLARIAKSMGVTIRLQSTVDCAALLEFQADLRWRITLPQHDSTMHQRYAVAHALAHVALHHLRPGMARRIEVSEDFRIDHAVRLNSEANDFALQLLIPQPALHYALHTMQARNHLELAHLFEVPELLIKQRMADLNLELRQPLAHHHSPEVE